MNLISDKYLLLYSFCKVVSGEDRSIITNLQKGYLKFIPNEMAEVIKLLKTDTVGNVKQKFEDQTAIFDSYIKFLTDNKFAHFTSSYKEFIDIPDAWCTPEVINNAVIEYNFNNYNLLQVFNQLDDLHLKFSELRLDSFNEDNVDELKDILNYLNSATLRSLTLLIPYTSKMINTVNDLLKSYSVIDRLIVYNSPFHQTAEEDSRQPLFIKKRLEEIRRETINRKYLVNNIEFFYEVQNYNPYYNKKIAIDLKGEIKNCIKNKRTFGNVTKDRIADVVNSDEFQDLWHVTHDKIIELERNELRYNMIITNDLEKIADGKYKIVV